MESRNNFNHLVILGSKTVILYLLFLIFAFGIPVYKEAKKVLENSIEKTYATRIVLGEASVAVTIADSDPERATGLSNRKSLSTSEGLFFIFDKPDYYSIWMKDMNFPIDIIWLDEENQVVDYQKNVSPKTYPKTFTPVKKAKYVLEVNAGFIEKHGIKVGDQATKL